ncbi:MAG: PD-(D/E)XK nuclease family protein [Actinomycetes bacterium]
MTEPDSIEQLPTRLSPSRAKDFVQCPKLFHFKTVLGRVTPPTPQTARGNVVHTALERLFDHPADERHTPDVALSYVRPAWEVMIDPIKSREEVAPGSPEAAIRDASALWAELLDHDSEHTARILRDAEALGEVVPPDSDIEAAMLAEAEASVVNYFTVERPWNFEPHGREVHVEATTGSVDLHGFIDRLDVVEGPDGEQRVFISDYKTGKVPSARFIGESYFAMRIYALLYFKSTGVIPRKLRLIYVAAAKEQAIQFEEVDQALLDRTEAEINRIWADIEQAARTGHWPTKVQKLCDWCHFKAECPAFAPAA